jgi:hypothetical protein
MTVPWRVVSQEALVAAAASAILLAYGCADEPTAPRDIPQTPREPSLVIRGFPTTSGGCVPEVITQATEEAETTLVTFSAPGKISCMPNLVQWGIDMADPVGVDTPQGNGFFRIESESRIAVNMPSPPYAAHGANYTPPQVMIEFDPPVRSVEFYYSRLANARAIWRGQIVGADSMQVEAVSRTPGTTSYQTWARKVLYSNVAHTTIPYDTWTYAKLATTSGDKIQWLWFDGTLMIDDLKITRTPLTCTPAIVQRGQQVRCVFTSSASWNVTSWEMTPDGSGGLAAAQARTSGTEELALSATTASSLPPVQETTSAKEWSGIAAVSGTVRVYVTDGAMSRSWQTHITVTDRPSQWEASWDYDEGTDQPLPDEEHILTSRFIGLNCPQQFPTEDDCLETERSRLQPDPHLEPNAGYTPFPIPTGPYMTYWIVTNIRYNMKRIANVHPGLLLTQSRKHPVTGAMLTKACKQGLGLKPNATSATANMYQVNLYCGEPGFTGADMDRLVAGAWGHEGFGYTPSGGVGHEKLAQAAGREEQNNPYKLIETLVSTDRTALESAIAPIVERIGDEITLKAAENNPINGGPKNNYTTPASRGWHYYWEPSGMGFDRWNRYQISLTF